MSDQNPLLPAIAPASGGALTTSTGPQRIATCMAENLLDVARSQERALAAQRRYRIGDYEFREADYAQIQRWARKLGMNAEEVVNGLAKSQKTPFYASERIDVDFQVQDGLIVSLVWDFDLFPLSDWAWVAGLELEHLGILNAPSAQLPLLPTCLRRLVCYENGLTSLNLLRVPGLQKLECSHNKLTHLDLTPVPWLQELDCSENPLTDLKLEPVPGLQKLSCRENQFTELVLTPVPVLQELLCNRNSLKKLDLMPVSGLKKLDCRFNQLTELDLTPVPELQSLQCTKNQITNLNLDPLPDLQELCCRGNQITELNLTPVPNLQQLSCSGNQLTELDLTPVRRLRWLWCDRDVIISNAPKDLDVRGRR